MSRQVDTLASVEDRLAEIRSALKVERAVYEASVKKIADSLSYPKPSYIPTAASFIKKAWIEDECVFYSIYGPLRYGKTSYAMKILASLYDTWDPEILKNFIVYHPKELIALIDKPRSAKFKYPAFVWDDAGVHLSAMKWEDPVLKRICEAMNLVGTLFAGVIFTTPLPTYVVKKIRGLPSCANVRIYKVNNNPNKPRVARGYYQWLAPDMKKSGVKPFIDDKFSAIMPTKFFEWYQPYREGYNDQNFKELEQALYEKAQIELDKSEIPKPVSPKVKKSNENIVL